MSKAAKLTEAEIAALLPQLPGWVVAGAGLHREYKFADFKTAMAFMQTAAPAIDRMEHHPEWSNVYDRVTVDLTTHDASGITQKDFELAKLLEGIANKLA